MRLKPSARTVRRLALLPGLMISLAAVLAAHAWWQPSRQRSFPEAPLVDVDMPAAASRLARALTFRTVSEQDRVDSSGAGFEAMRRHLRLSFPRAHAALSMERVGGHSLLYRWQGRDPSAKPVLMLAHQDVVPVAPGTEADWSEPPFSGRIRDRYIWGRGAWDNKGNLMAMMEAVEILSGSGFQPSRTVYFAFGHDEENGGEHGAAAIARLLEQRGVRFEQVFDEGWFITDGVLPAIDRPVALVGVAEKSIVTLELRAAAEPGHAAAPAPDGAIALLSRALVRLDGAAAPAAAHPVTDEMLDTLSPEMRFPARLVVGNRWLFDPLVRAAMGGSPGTAAMLGTTFALTVVRAGDKENVLPGTANALVNVRLAPGDTPAAARRRVEEAVADPRVQVRIRGQAQGAPAPTPTSSKGYRTLERTIRQTYPDTVVAPALLIGGTDSRHFARIADEIYRFTPVRARRDDLARFHGTNERIAIDDYVGMIRFYSLLLSNLSGDPDPDSAPKGVGRDG